MALLCCCPAPLCAYDIYNALPGALDIPGINATLKLTPNGAPIQADIFGFQTINIQAYFDTGASGVLLSDETAGYLGVQKALSGGTPVTFADVGVGGTEIFNVSNPYYIGLAPFNATVDAESPAAYTQTFGPIRMQIAAPVPEGSPLTGLDVFGMPVFANKVVVINPRPADPFNANGTPKDVFDLGRMNVNVYDPGQAFTGATADPGIPHVAHHLQLSYASFSRFTSVSPLGSDGPTLAHNPFIGPNPVLALETNPPVDSTPPVTFGFGAKSTTGSFLLDTGAAASMISTSKAAALSVRYRAGTQTTENPKLELFDPANPLASGTLLADQFTLTIGGIGGTKTVAGFYLDDMILRTKEGNAANLADPNHLHYHGAAVLVNDISVADPLTGQSLTLDGILGMNLLTGSVELIPDPVLGFTLGAMNNGAYDWLVFDEPSGILGLALKGGPAIWQGTSGANWTVATSWGGSTLNSATAEARFTTAGGAIANLDIDQTVNKLTFDATTGNNYTISGPGKLTLAGTTPAISTTAANTGTQTVAVNLDLGAGTTIAVNGGTLNLNSPTNATLGSNVTATIAAGATLNLGGAGNALSNGTTTHANVTNDGTLAAMSAGQRVGHITGTGATNVTAAGATLTANSIRQGTLSIGAGNTVNVAANGTATGVSRVTNLSINAMGKLNLSDNDLIVASGNLAAVSNLVKVGLNINGALWDGPGISSSTAAANPLLTTALGVIPNNDGTGALIYATFGGIATGNSDVLVKYTYFGDADLNGVVDTTQDFDLYLTGLTSGGSLGGWLFGDFDYSGTVDSSQDFDLFLTGLTGQSGGALLTDNGPTAIDGSAIAIVPEPSTILLGGLGLIGFLGYRLRRQIGRR